MLLSPVDHAPKWINILALVFTLHTSHFTVGASCVLLRDDAYSYRLGSNLSKQFKWVFQSPTILIIVVEVDVPVVQVPAIDSLRSISFFFKNYMDSTECTPCHWGVD